ncbi:MAG: (Fe-S)-binding protein [Gammaproteobacteria bacterium]|nr:(Fe-S)-binding protein [Gammaproteobacteria bacterium]
METLVPLKEIADAIKLNGGVTADLCYQCGTCDVVCPWNRVSRFSMRKIVRQAALGLTEIESEDIWRCTTCGTCPQRCPRGVNQIELGRSLRRIATEYGVFPDSVTPIVTVAGSLMSEGNPFDLARGKRAEWAQGLGVRQFKEGMEILYLPGCYLAYDPRMKKVAVATAKILNAAGVDYGILGDKESCCGESIRKAGNEEAFRHLAKSNIKNLIEAGVKKILVSSPHCYHTYKNEYPEFGVHFEIVHISQYLKQLMQEGRLQPKQEYVRKITYHDPCYLGRHNGVFDAPREVLNKVLGTELNELAERRENSFCCGGGGGRIWMETPKEERFSDVRLRQAVDLGAEVLVTACPYCITNFTDSSLRLDQGQAIEVKDITEVVAESL